MAGQWYFHVSWILLGYVEYRGGYVKAPLVGNGIMSLGYLLTTSPLTAVLSHAAMHVAAVPRGPATMVQLPPHYEATPSPSRPTPRAAS